MPPSSSLLAPSPLSILGDEPLLGFRLRNGAASLIVIDFWDFAWSVCTSSQLEHIRDALPLQGTRSYIHSHRTRTNANHAQKAKEAKQLHPSRPDRLKFITPIQSYVETL